MSEQPLSRPNKFDQLWQLTNELRQKLESRFELHLDPSTESLQNYGGDQNTIRGSLSGWSGPEVDWLVHGWLGKPDQPGFSTMRLTAWLKPHVRVPHLAFEFGTIPHLFFYIDCIPRTDLIVDLDALKRYYEPMNQPYLELRSHPDLTPFVSKSVLIRQFQSPISLCYTCPASDEMVNLVRTLALEMLDRWLTWVDEAELVPPEEQKVLAERDFQLRRISAEEDPGNKVAAQMLGAELAAQLVRALWGGDRTLAS